MTLVTALLLALQVPTVAWTHRQEMTRSAFRVHGPNAPIATLAGQIHQESNWKCSAVSWAGAQGCAQFMPATAADMAKNFPDECAPANPFSAAWAFRCRDRYMAALLRGQRKVVLPTATVVDSACECRVPLPPTVSECSAWAFGLRAYNGGGGWINRDRRKAAAAGLDPNDWRAVRDVNAGRRESAHKENREYPERIYGLSARYAAAGWGEAVPCG